ncbi:hypothetical protein H072_3088 [Dactylellina haptotyla CBS 200.50]|uniref:Uncharacterized protein n=1 Tax=Dactylellina haptotyla (strain CBS 200.50) TaxID=1284197 RepID=S8AJ99_DACHA|nr:hypothetical protein H072_3088 [Dactylellina haptotyla CBS 200.50]
MGGISKRYQGSKYLDIEVYIEMVKAAIDADSLPIFTSLQGDLYTEFLEECSHFLRFDILRSTVLPGYEVYFKMLLQNRSYEDALDFFYPTPAPGHTILQRAAWFGEIHIVELMLLKQPLLLNVCGRELIRESPFIEYPIQLAAKANRLGVIKVMVPFLTKSKVDVTISGNSNTALTYAIKNQNLEMVRVLLDAGADITLGGANNPPKDPGDMLRNTSLPIPDELNFPLLQLMKDPNVDILDLFIAKRHKDLLFALERFRIDENLSAYYNPWLVFNQGVTQEAHGSPQLSLYSKRVGTVLGPYWTMYQMIKHAIPMTRPGILPGSDYNISQEFLDFFCIC